MLLWRKVVRRVLSWSSQLLSQESADHKRWSQGADIFDEHICKKSGWMRASCCKSHWLEPFAFQLFPTGDPRNHIQWHTDSVLGELWSNMTSVDFLSRRMVISYTFTFWTVQSLFLVTILKVIQWNVRSMGVNTKHGGSSQKGVRSPTRVCFASTGVFSLKATFSFVWWHSLLCSCTQMVLIALLRRVGNWCRTKGNNSSAEWICVQVFDHAIFAVVW